MYPDSASLAGGNNRWTRTRLSVTWSVWRALFLREALTRMSAGRMGWFWLIFEPVAHVVILLLLFSIVRNRNVPGADVVLFLTIGLAAFRLFRNPAQRSGGAISANSALFSYRQVKPVDTVLVRCFLEGTIQVVVLFVLLVGCALLDKVVLPHDPLSVFCAFILMWLLGTGIGLVLAASATLIPEIGKVVQLMFIPLYLASGVLFSPAILPPQVRELLLYNPIMHGLELARGGFFANYPVVDGVSWGYLLAFVVGFLVLGLAMHRRFASGLMAR